MEKDVKIANENCKIRFYTNLQCLTDPWRFSSWNAKTDAKIDTENAWLQYCISFFCASLNPEYVN